MTRVNVYHRIVKPFVELYIKINEVRVYADPGTLPDIAEVISSGKYDALLVAVVMVGASAILSGVLAGLVGDLALMVWLLVIGSLLVASAIVFNELLYAVDDWFYWVRHCVEAVSTGYQPGLPIEEINPFCTEERRKRIAAIRALVLGEAHEPG